MRERGTRTDSVLISPMVRCWIGSRPARHSCTNSPEAGIGEARGKNRMRGADAWVPGEGDFLPRGEDANAIVGVAGSGRQYESGLGQVHPAGDCLHLCVFEALGIEDDGQRISHACARGKTSTW